MYEAKKKPHRNWKIALHSFVKNAAKIPKLSLLLFKHAQSLASILLYVAESHFKAGANNEKSDN